MSGSPDDIREWDAGTYDRVSAPQLEWGREVLERLELSGAETALDAGCGTGRVSELIADALPRGRLVAVDGSRSMVEKARERLGGRAEVAHADLLDLDLGLEVDAIFSSATFHWIGDHPRLFERLAAHLRPGGRLEAQCGGAGNVAGFFAVVDEVVARERWAQYLARLQETRYFAGAAETEERLVAAGFAEARCWLAASQARPPEPRAYIESVCLREHTVALPAQLRAEFVDDVFEAWGPDRVLDYVRLNISARRR